MTAPCTELKLTAMLMHPPLSISDLTRRLTMSLQATLVKELANEPFWCGDAM